MKLFHLPKQAQMEVQFNWVFILLVGVVILGFFFTIISNQNKKANVENAQDLIETLDSVFNTIYVNPNAVNTFHISKARIDFACEQGLSEYYIQGTGPVDTSKDIIFTPNTLRGNTIVTWTKEWEVPFEAGLFTYMANDMTLFIFVNDSTSIGIVEDLYLEMPDAFEKIMVEPSSVETTIQGIKGYDRLVVIKSGDVPLSGIVIGGPSGVYTRTLTTSGGNELISSVIFDEDTNKRVYYYTREMLWGAIFTDDDTSYGCTIDKAAAKMSYVARVLQERDEAIAQELLNTNCYNYLSPAALELKTIADDAPDWRTTYWNSVLRARNNLERDQQLLLRGYRCPNIY